MRLFFTSVVFALIAQAGLSDTVTLRAECRKSSDRGCTASYPVCHTAPDGKFIRASSLSPGSVLGYWSMNPSCGSPEVGSLLPYTIPGTDLETQLPLSFCANLHVESGSGFSSIGKVAYVDCAYSFSLSDLP